MKKLLLLVLISFLLTCGAVYSRAQEEGGTLTGDAAIESQYKEKTKIDSTGGLNKAGGIGGLGVIPLDLNVTIAGFPLAVSKKSLDKFRGPDVINPCAAVGFSGISTDPTLCNYLLSQSADSVTCTGADEYYSANAQKCVKKCPFVNQYVNEAGACTTQCGEGQTEDTPGNCKCADSNKVIYNGYCVTKCNGNQVDPDGDGKCECPFSINGSSDPSSPDIQMDGDVCHAKCQPPLSDPQGIGSCDVHCTAPQVAMNGHCCDSGLGWDDDKQQCVQPNPCSGAQQMNYEDPANPHCACPVDTVTPAPLPPFDPNYDADWATSCECPVGTHMVDSGDPDTLSYTCVCNDSNALLDHSTHKCNCRDTTYNYNATTGLCVSTCAAGTISDGSGNCCPDTSPQDSVCDCPTGQSWNNNHCSYNCFSGVETDNGLQCCLASQPGRCCDKDPASPNSCATHPTPCTETTPGTCSGSCKQSFLFTVKTWSNVALCAQSIAEGDVLGMSGVTCTSSTPSCQ